MAIYAIGDVQGCFRSLQALVAQLPLQPEDRIWLCGDLVNRGPNSLEVLRWAMAQGERLVTVLGNHDLHLLSAAAGQRKLKKSDSFRDVLEAEDRESLLSWLRARPLLYREAGHLLVHAGLHPSWSLETAAALAAECQEALQTDSWLAAWSRSKLSPPPWSESLAGVERLSCAFSVLVGIRTVDSGGALVDFAGSPQERPAGSEPWFDLRKDETETVIFGHWAALGLHLGAHHVCLDTGCVWGNELTAMRLEDRRVFRQPTLEG